MEVYLVIRFIRHHCLDNRYHLLPCVSYRHIFARLAISLLISFYSFRDLDRREAELNIIGKGDRQGFKDEQ